MLTQAIFHVDFGCSSLQYSKGFYYTFWHTILRLIDLEIAQ